MRQIIQPGYILEGKIYYGSDKPKGDQIKYNLIKLANDFETPCFEGSVNIWN